MNVYRHLGDLGDVLAALPAIRQLGGGHLILGNRNGLGAREPMTRVRFDAISPLLEVQDYISGVSLEDDATRQSHDFADFRCKPPAPNYNLASWQGSYFGLDHLDLNPWLFAHPAPESEGRAVFARSLRYHGANFPWRQMVERWPGALFVGLPEEHAAFCSAFGQVQHRPTSNLLEVAELIAGSEILISNQTCAFWIGCGLGHALVQELDRDQVNRNSVIQGSNAEYL
jgi:hypothetical protein